MSDKKKISNNEDLFLARLDAYRTGEEHDASSIDGHKSPLTTGAVEDLETISELFSAARPEPGDIPDSVDNIVLGHIRQKSREIKRSGKVAYIFPSRKWAAAAAIGVFVCVILITQYFKMDKHENSAFNDNKASMQAELSKKGKGTGTKEVLHGNFNDFKLSDSDSGISRLERVEDSRSMGNIKPVSAGISRYINGNGSTLTANAGQYREDDFFIRELNRLSLPDKPVTKDELPQIKSIIQQALELISEHIELLQKNQTFRAKVFMLGKMEKGISQPPLIEGLFCFRDWLNRQKCVYQTSFPLIETSGRYAAKILTSCPGQVPLSVSLDIKDQKPEKYDLVLLTGPVSLRFLHLTESNK